MRAIGYAALVALFTVATLEREPYDDAYFFKRFALNALDHGVLAWNVGDGPVYGITSQLFQAIAIGVAALTRDYWMLGMRLLLAACLVAAFPMLLATTRRFDRGIAATVAVCSPVALYSVSSGMETALCFALLACLLWLLYDERGRRAHWAWAPLLVFLCWLARPDVLLLALPPLIAERWTSRRPPLRELAALGLGVATSLAAFKLYYGTALPLPFYAKHPLFSPYDAHFLELSAAGKRRHFASFLSAGLGLALAAAQRRDRTNAALLGAVVLFSSYHLLATIDVMGMHGRFFAPALPLLAVAAARAAASTTRGSALVLGAVYFAVCAALAAASWLPEERLAPPYLAVSALATLVLFAAPLAPALAGHGSFALLLGFAAAIVIADPPRLRAPPRDEAYLARHVEHSTVFRGLFTLKRCFGEEIALYHSEIGVPGLVFARGRVIDLAGLMNEKWLFRQQSVDALCRAERPEAFFLPHQNYRELNAEIERSRCLEGYRRVVDESRSALHVRNDLVERYLACDGRNSP